jgi:hypothetical protein
VDIEGESVSIEGQSVDIEGQSVSMGQSVDSEGQSVALRVRVWHLSIGVRTERGHRVSECEHCGSECGI